MRQAVIDASIFRLLILEQATPDRIGVIKTLIGSLSPVQPAHWPLEVTGLALRGARAQNLPDAVQAEMRQRLSALVASAEIDGLLPAVAVFDTVQRYGAGVYDAPYLELALRRQLPILTRDSGLRDAALAAGVELILCP